MKYFKGSLIITFLGLALVCGVVWFQTQSVEKLVQALLTTSLLAVLEISLSFDNAVVNATVMKTMSEVWKKRFLTWGMLIAVFGMRLIFPLVIVSIMASIGPLEALKLSIYDANKYAEIMTSSHLHVASFGGMFLLLVFLHFFMNDEKEIHWIHFLEKPMARSANFKGLELVTTLGTLILFSSALTNVNEQKGFLVSGLLGIITFLSVHGFSNYLESKQIVEDAEKTVATAGLSTFLYLEVLDASFSFDGVIGAFALTNSLFLIMIGLSIGAFFVRSLTIYFVEKRTVEQFIFLEHGAFYALGALAIMMLSSVFIEIPEWVTGISGMLILVLSILFSIKNSHAESNSNH